MQSKKIKSIIIGFGFTLLSICAFGTSPVRVHAQETITSEEDSYHDNILSADISTQDKKMLLDEKKLQEQHNELLEEGWVLQDIVVEDCEIPQNNFGNIQTFSTYQTKEGKVVTRSYVQPTKSQKKYNTKLYKQAQDMKKRISFASNFIPGKFSWVASTLFGINTEKFVPWFNTGYQKLEENATYYVKDAYYKEGKRYWIGYEVSKLKVAGTVMTYYHNSKKEPIQKSKDYSKTFTSKNYNKNNTYLVNLAKKHYNTGWINESLPYSSTYKLN